MKKMKIKTTAILLLLSITIYGYSEDIKKVKYGKVTKEELGMAKYEQDTSADAVVLYAFGDFDATNFKFTNHIRIKILKQTGSSRANMAFSGKLRSIIKGCTYNLENGEVVKSQLKKESIFEERVYGERYVTRIALPNVREGSVFEVEYTQDGIPNDFEFQKNIPVIYSALSFPQNTYVDIKLQEYGILGFTYKDATTWIVKDMPAFKREPFMKSENDYKVRMEFELASIKAPNFFKIYCDSWGAVTSWYMGYSDFGGLLDGLNFCLGELADSVNANSKTDQEKLINAYEIVKRRVKWDKNETCYGSQPFEKTLKLKSGNSADINLILVALLRKVGITCNPVVFSTRENGQISRYFPTIDKFNYVIAQANVSGEPYYMDASQEYLPFGVIPDKLLGCNGHVVNKSIPLALCFVRLDPIHKEKRTSMNSFKLDSTGIITGKVIINREDYNAIEFKEELKGYTDLDAYIERLESENMGIRIDSYNFSDVNNLSKPFKQELDITIGNTSNKDVIIINPLLFAEVKNNPFTIEKRVTPISFPETVDYTTVVSIALPANYRVAETPKSTVIMNQDKTLKFSYKIDYNDTQVSVRMKFNVDKLQFSLSEYTILRQVFEMMVQKQSESIILKKI